MNKPHIPAETVKKYLLGEIGEDQAAVLEEEYFVHPALLAQVRTVEDLLIGDYLNGRLSGARKESFERRYLSTPALRKRLEEVRQAQELRRREPSLRRWVYLAAAAGVIAAAISFLPPGAAPPVPSREMVEHIPPPATLLVRLAPGVHKSAGAMAQFISPPPGSKVSLTLELPGRYQPPAAFVRVNVIRADGVQVPVWRGAGSIRPASTPSGEELTADLDSSVLPPGDYTAQAETAGGDILEVYVFRVTRLP